MDHCHHHHHHHHRHNHNYFGQFVNLYFSMISPLYCFVFILSLFTCMIPLFFFRRRRSSVNVTFTADMVQILPGYPKQSDDSPGVILLAFYLSLPQGISESSIVPETVLSKIVMDHKENIQTSIGGEILSADPYPTQSN